jgi:hypothetical protein
MLAKASTGEVTSHATARHRGVWFLDQYYDGLAFRVCQAFFPKTLGAQTRRGPAGGRLRHDERSDHRVVATNSAFTALTRENTTPSA